MIVYGLWWIVSAVWFGTLVWWWRVGIVRWVVIGAVVVDIVFLLVFFFNGTATTAIYTESIVGSVRFV